MLLECMLAFSASSLCILVLVSRCSLLQSCINHFSTVCVLYSYCSIVTNFVCILFALYIVQVVPDDCHETCC